MTHSTENTEDTDHTGNTNNTGNTGNTETAWEAVFTGKRLPAPDDQDEQIADQARQILLWRQAQQDTLTPDQQITPKQAQAYYHYVDNVRRHRKLPWYKRIGLLSIMALVSVLVICLIIATALVSSGYFNQSQQETAGTDVVTPVVSRVESGDTPAMVTLPGGDFIMGCRPGWDDVLGGCKTSEKPAHTVTVKPFRMGRYEITVGQFKRFVAATDYQTTAERPVDAGCTIKPAGQLQWVLSKAHNWRNPGFPQTDQHPVVCISWQDTQHYLAWLNQKTGKHYRLPSEEEWEYAARGGKITAFFWGDQADRQFANYQGTGGPDQWHHTAPVGQFSSNAFGLYDVAGNAWEWVKSCWRENYLNASIGENACTSGTNAARARRGGGWDNYPPSIRSAYRNVGHELERSYLYGFRIAHDADITHSP